MAETARPAAGPASRSADETGTTAFWHPGRPKTRPFRHGATKILEADPDAVLTAGQEIAARYRVVRLLGEGGMGRVYEAQRIADGARVAIKVLRHERDRQGGEHLARFRQEAEAATQVGHPGIVRVFEYDRTPDGVVFMAMECLDGESLEEWLEKPGRLRDGLGFISAICRALYAAHLAGIVHRDLKPANLFIHNTAAGTQPRILDFGIAKVSRTDHTRIETEAGTVLGTPYYLAPERALGRTLDLRADLYSVGIILYEVMTGMVPFVGDSFMAILGQHVKAMPLDPRQAAPERSIPDGIARLTMSLLDKEPDARPQSAAEVADEIDRLLRVDGTLIDAVSTGPREEAESDAHTVNLDVVAARPTAAPSEAPTKSGAPRGETEAFGPMMGFSRGEVPRTRYESVYTARPPAPIAPAPRRMAWALGAIAASGVLAAAAVLAGLVLRSEPTQAVPEASNPAALSVDTDASVGSGDPAGTARAAAPVDSVPVDVQDGTNAAVDPAKPVGQPEDGAEDGPEDESADQPLAPAVPEEESKPKPRKPRSPRAPSPPPPKRSVEPKPEPSDSGLPAFKDDVYKD